MLKKTKKISITSIHINKERITNLSGWGGEREEELGCCCTLPILRFQSRGFLLEISFPDGGQAK